MVSKRLFQYKFYSISIWIIGINLLFFLIKYIFPYSTAYLSLNVRAVTELHFYWQFISYLFSHADFSHLLLNMLGLFFFGYQVEKRIGSIDFLLFYLTTGILAGIFSFIVYFISGMWNVFLLGASGAVFAVLLAYAVFFPRSIIYIWGLIPVRAPLLILGYIIIELISLVLSRNQGVAHLTHLAGLGFAWLYFLTRFGVNPLNSLIGRDLRR